MKLFLHLAQSGLTLSDLSLRIYDGVNPVAFSSFLFSSISSSGTDYALDGIPDLFQSGNWTLTFENPSGVYHARRLGFALSQPQHVIIPIREVFANPISSLSIRVFKDGVETIPLSGDVVRLASDGEYAVSGWASTPYAEQWSVRWIYSGLTYALQWTGGTVATPSGTFYQEIRAVHSPIPYQIDGDNRQLFSCNFLARVVSPTSRFEDEIEEILRTASPSIIPSNEVIYIGPKVSLPQGPGPFCVILATGGYEPDETHDSKRENRGLQIITCAEDYEVARDRAESIWHYLDGLRNVFVTLPT